MDSTEGSARKQYELGLFLLALHNASKYPNLQFQLGREVKIADKFNDVAIKYNGSHGQKHIFCQVKHLDYCNIFINERVLLGLEKISLNVKDFKLQKYFQSYLRIIDQFRDSDNELEKLIIFTNTGLEDSIKDSLNCDKFNLSKLLEVDESSKENFLKIDENSEIYKELLSTRTDFDVLVKILAEYNTKIKNERTMALDNTYLKYYQTALIDEKIISTKISNRGNECKFNEDFQNNINLSDLAKKFRECILKESKNNEISEIKWKVVNRFGLKGINKKVEEQIIEELGEYLQNNGENQIIFKAKNENNVSYYYLELIAMKIFKLNKSVLIFHEDFITNIKSKYFSNIRNNLFEKLAITEDDFQNRLKKISFSINLHFDTNKYLKPLVKFPDKIIITNQTIKNFLNTLEFKVNQPNVEDLFNSFKSKFKTDDVIKYSTQFFNLITNWTKENGQNETWMSNRDATKLLEELQNKCLLNKVCYLTENLNEFFDEKINSFNLKYTTCLPEMKRFLTEDKQILCIMTEQTLLTCIKLRQYIKEHNTIFNNNYVLFKSDKIVKIKQRKEILQACKDATVKYVFVSVDNLTEENVDLLKSIVQLNRKLFVIKLGTKNKLPIDSENEKIEYVIDNTIDVSNLEDISAIRKVSIEFQNKQISLNDLFKDETNLEKCLDANILFKIIEGGQVVIGTHIPFVKKVTSSCNINRTFFQNNLWSELTVNDLFETDEQKKIIIISGGAGLGKTTVLNEIGKFLKNENPSDWIIRINLNEHTAQFKSILDNNEVIDKTFICKLLSIEKTKIEYNLIIAALEYIGNIFVLIDALDEICPNYMELVIKFIKLLEETCVKRIVVTTRPNVLEKFVSKLHKVNKYNLGYFSEENQKEFLSSEFKEKLDENYLNSDDRRRIYIQNLLEVHKRQNRCDDEHNFTSIPLNLKVLSEIYAKKDSNDWESCEEFLNGNHDAPNLSNKINLSNIYNKCIENKLKRHLTEKEEMDLTKPSAAFDFKDKFDKIIEIHKEIGTRAIFDQDTIKQFNLPEQFNEYNIEEHNFGLIDYYREGKPIFIHKSYAEYFTALFIIDFLKQPEKSFDFFNNVVNHCLVEEEFEGVRVFLNFLIEKKIICNETNLSNCNSKALENAVVEKNANIVRYLLAHNIRYDYSVAQRILNTAVQNDSSDIIKQLITYQDPNNRKEYQIIEQMINLGITDFECKYDTVLHYAVAQNNVSMFEILLKKGVSLNTKNDYGQTALHVAVIFENERIFKILLQNGANVNIQDITLCTPIHWSLINKNVKITETLFKNNFHVNVRNYKGETYLFLCVINNWIHILKKLLNHFEDPNIQNAYKKTPLHIAVEQKSIEIVRELLIYQTDSDIQNEIEKTELMVNSDLNNFKLPHFTALHYATSRNNVKMIEILLEKRLDINSRNAFGYTALHVAVILECGSTVEILLQHGADVNLQDKILNTPIHWAFVNKNHKLTETLLKYNFDPYVTNNLSESYLSLSVNNNWIDISEKLRKCESEYLDADEETSLYRV